MLVKSSLILKYSFIVRITQGDQTTGSQISFVKNGMNEPNRIYDAFRHPRASARCLACKLGCCGSSIASVMKPEVTSKIVIITICTNFMIIFYIFAVF